MAGLGPMSGQAGPRAKLAEEFAAALGGFLQIPVHLQDERLSTVEADRALREAGAKGRDRRRAVDRSAATVPVTGWPRANRTAAATAGGRTNGQASLANRNWKARLCGDVALEAVRPIVGLLRGGYGSSPPCGLSGAASGS